MSLIRAQNLFGRPTARMVAPVLRVTGYRFKKAMRGQWVIDHVAANLLADGIEPGVVKFAKQGRCQMSYPLLYRGKHIVLSMAGTLRYHIGGPFTTGYESLKAAYAAIDALIDNQGEEHEATAATALPAGH